MAIMVTGGAGFIGSNFILDWLKNSNEVIINLDKLTYAGNIENLVSLKNDSRHIFIKGDIKDSKLVKKIFAEFNPWAVINLAAESHVDRSIYDPGDFIQTNILGTFNLLEQSLQHYNNLSSEDKKKFRFLHVSTDEVYGSLKPDEPAFTENKAYAPNSPYSASKASSDHLARAYFQTYQLPVLTTNCSNNYGPFQFPEKLIPLTILNAISKKDLPVYGDGLQIRDWLYVTDHCSAIRKVLKYGMLGATYNIGGWNEKTNIEVVNTICNLLDKIQPRNDGISYMTQIKYVKDRPGHDRRYAIDARKIKQELDWEPSYTFEEAIQKTVKWYLSSEAWIKNILSGDYLKWIDKHYIKIL